MKPTFQFSGGIDRASFLTGDLGPRSIQVDYNFQSGSVGDFGRGHGRSFPSFHRIREDYLNGEARVHFAAEAAIFALIVLTAAVPVYESIRDLVQLVFASL
jgi:hypothetical protein